MLPQVCIAIALIAQTPSTKVTVRDNTKHPAANATVNVVDSAGRLVTSAITDSNGVASLTIPAAHLPKGFQIQASMQGYYDRSQPTIINWTLTPTQTGQLDLKALGTGTAYDIVSSEVASYHSESPCSPCCWEPVCCWSCGCNSFFVPANPCSDCYSVLDHQYGSFAARNGDSLGVSRTIAGAAGSITSGTTRDAVLTILVPQDAIVTINGKETVTAGTHRQFISRRLEFDQNYKYVVLAKVVRNGKVLTDSQEVVLRAGDKKTVAVNLGRQNNLPLALNP
jgi:uncharacterized protein (TIGR03000 family)